MNKYQEAYKFIEQGMGEFSLENGGREALSAIKELVEQETLADPITEIEKVGDSAIPNGIDKTIVFECPRCYEYLKPEYFYCPTCGKAIRWR